MHGYSVSSFVGAFCSDRCENLGDRRECLRCNSGHVEPNCCKCQNGYQNSSDGTCIIEHFLPYGVANGDRVFPPNDDTISSVGNIAIPLNFFNTLQTKIFVSLTITFTCIDYFLSMMVTLHNIIFFFNRYQLMDSFNL